MWSHRGEGWFACVLVWIFAMAFGYSWGKLIRHEFICVLDDWFASSRSMCMDPRRGNLAAVHSRKGHFDRSFLQLGKLRNLYKKPMWLIFIRQYNIIDEQLYWYVFLNISCDLIFLNKLLVGQVTPSMLAHISFGTFIFFGVSGTCHPSFRW